MLMKDKSQEKVAEFREKMTRYNNKRILIIIRGTPDPDSISSALAHKVILDSLNIESTILHLEEVSHQENRALLKLLGIELTLYKADFSFLDYAAISLVDTQKPDINILEAVKGLPIASIVDHHDLGGSILEADFIDIRKDVGATATIYAEYLENLGLIEDLKDKATAIATALIHGIRVDTENLIMAQESDYLSMAYLARFADKILLKKISRQNLSPTTMEIIFKAYQSKEIYDTLLVASAGIVRKDDRDAIPQSADFLLRRVGIDTVMVYGIVGEYIDCSLRTNSDVIQVEKFIKETFPDVIIGEYGGRFHMGGFRLPLGIFKSMITGDDKQVLSQLVDRYMKKQIAHKLGHEKS